jgi:hypothetical protein
MPERKTLEHAKTAKRQGKAASTQAGAFVKEQIDHVRSGKHGVRSTKQAIAIGLSEARQPAPQPPGKLRIRARAAAIRARNPSIAAGHG